MKTQLVLFLAILGLNVSAQTNSVHNWHLKNGEVCSGMFLSSGTEMVVINNYGTNRFLKIADLSTNDWLYFYECKTNQRQMQLNAEALQLANAGFIELTEKLVDIFPEKVDDHNGWMDVQFLELNEEYVYPRMELGFSVEDKSGDFYFKCYAEKVFLPEHISNLEDISNSTANPLIPVITNLKRGDKVRLLGKVVNGSFYSQYRLFHVEKVEMIESAADAASFKKVKEDLEDGNWQGLFKR